ncbi:MAG: ATP-binding cassette domain-containing protein [Ekhidna sp.]|uniref:ABC transporter ATP-binding protein n=1 Tax=Ekhidna sp. TaxID=2608089 RepID=UPI0032EE7281
MSLLKVENVNKSYSEHQALTNVSMEIPEKTIFGLLGPNGAGKTTLIRIINQIIEADNGTILFDGEVLNPNHIREIGYLPEERGLYKKMKVGEQLVYLGQLRGLSLKEASRRGKAWCQKLEIIDWWGKKVEDLSKGMAQKIQFIATVMHEPKLIILDEPFSGFDPVNANLIKDEILELREKGSTIIFSTHRMESVEQLCDHVAMINKSQKILDGSKIDIKEQFRDGTYHVEYREGEVKSGGGFELLSTEEIGRGLKRSLIQYQSDGNPNELLKQLVSQVEIHSFVERIPSMNDIFISLVKGENPELIEA